MTMRQSLPLLISLVSLALLGFLRWWFFLRRPRVFAALPELEPVKLAYLIGGARRAKEVALFMLSRNGFFLPPEHGLSEDLFRADPHADCSNLTPLELELYDRLSSLENATAEQLVVPRAQATEGLELSLQNEGLFLSPRDRSIVITFAFFAALFTSYFTLKVHGAKLSFENFDLAYVTTALLWIAFFRIASKPPVRTPLGDAVVESFETAVETRRAAQRAGDNETYDRLWSLKDDVLLAGFYALAGSPFYPVKKT